MKTFQHITYKSLALDQRASALISLIDYTKGNLTAATGSITVTAYGSIVNAVASTGSIDITAWASMNEAKSTTTITVANYANLIAVAATGTIQVIDYTKLILAVATGTITITDYTQLTGKTFTVGGNTYTEGIHFSAITSNDVTATNLAAVLTLDLDFNAVEVGAIITITAAASGSAGNSIGMSSNATGGVTLSGATLAGGYDHAVVTVDGTALTQGTNWTASVSNDSTATSLAAAIHALANVNAGAVTNTVTITAAVAGTAGNSLTMTISDAVNLIKSGNTLSGGIAHASITVDGTTLTQGTNWNAVTDNNTTATNIASAIHALANVNSTATLAVVTIEAAVAGTAGNLITASVSDAVNLTLSASALSGGLNNAIIIIDGTSLTAGSSFTASVSNDSTATSLAAAINALASVNASATVAHIAIVAASKGTAGNSLATTSTIGSGFTINQATLSGGIAGSTLTVDSQVLTAGIDFTAGTNNDTTAESIKTAVHTLANVNATRTNAIVTVTAAVSGTGGNAITMATNRSPHITLSGATLTGGTGTFILTVNGTALTESTDWDATTSNAVSATNLSAAINAIVGFDIAIVNNIITAYWTTPGATGNTKTLVTSDSTNLTISGATFLGGVDATYSDIFEYADQTITSIEAELVVLDIQGTNPTIDVTPQYSFDGNTWTNHATVFTQKTAIGNEGKEFTFVGSMMRFKIVLGGTNTLVKFKINAKAI
jgi:hypothetical protein